MSIKTTKISELPKATNINENDLIVINQEGRTKTVELGDIISKSNVPTEQLFISHENQDGYSITLIDNHNGNFSVNDSIFLSENIGSGGNMSYSNGKLYDCTNNTVDVFERNGERFYHKRKLKHGWERAYIHDKMCVYFQGSQIHICELDEEDNIVRSNHIVNASSLSYVEFSECGNFFLMSAYTGSSSYINAVYEINKDECKAVKLNNLATINAYMFCYTPDYKYICFISQTHTTSGVSYAINLYDTIKYARTSGYKLSLTESGQFKITKNSDGYALWAFNSKTSSSSKDRHSLHKISISNDGIFDTERSTTTFRKATDIKWIMTLTDDEKYFLFTEYNKRQLYVYQIENNEFVLHDVLKFPPRMENVLSVLR